MLSLKLLLLSLKENIGLFSLILDGIWKPFSHLCDDWIGLTMHFFSTQSVVNKSQARPAFLAISKAEQQLKETLWCKTRESSPCNYTWSCLHMSLPQSLSRSLILLMLLGNLVLIPLVNVFTATPNPPCHPLLSPSWFICLVPFPSRSGGWVGGEDSDILSAWSGGQR